MIGSIKQLRRYAGLLAAFMYSGANFILAFTLQRHTSAEDFGIYAIVQVVLQFGVSLSNAVLCAPLVLSLRKSDSPALPSFMRISTIFCVAGATIVSIAISFWGAGLEIGLAAGALALLSWSRWFLRSVEQARHNFMASVRADILYSLVVLVTALTVLIRGDFAVNKVLWIQILGNAAAFLAIGSGIRNWCSFGVGASSEPFVISLRRHGAWATLGVVTTEATANAHAWIVGFFLGPKAFAPIAAVTLFFRPVLIASQALTQYERPRMAKAIEARDCGDLLGQCVFFTRSSLICLVMNAAAVAAIVGWFPRLIGNGQYPLADVWMLALVILMTFLARVFRGAESTVLQAGGSFRSLAMTTVATAPVAIGLVAAASAARSPSPALLMTGVFVAEALSCILIRREKRRFMKTEMSHEG